VAHGEPRLEEPHPEALQPVEGPMLEQATNVRREQQR